MVVLRNLVPSIIISILPCQLTMMQELPHLHNNRYVVNITFWQFQNYSYPRQIYLKQSIYFDFVLPNHILNCHYLLESLLCDIHPSSVAMATITWGSRASSLLHRSSSLSSHSKYDGSVGMGSTTLELQYWCPRSIYYNILCNLEGWEGIFLVVFHADLPLLMFLLRVSHHILGPYLIGLIVVFSLLIFDWCQFLL